ncbi:hypothetical protein A8B78_04325 [Jannaschia sp. EhC01]|nr:hypothetical protein A8B78_04325 [Jannaschia sp. EhC01]
MPDTHLESTLLSQRFNLHGGVWFFEPNEPGIDDVIALMGGLSHLIDRTTYAQILPLMDGYGTGQDIVDAVRDTLTPTQTLAALDGLLNKRIIYPCAPGTTAPARGAVAAKGTLPMQIAAPITVAVQLVGDQPLDLTRLARPGVTFTDDPAQADGTLVFTDHYLRPELAQINRTYTKPWILIGPDGHDLWVGPLILPGQSACWDCLAQRLRHNRRVEGYVWDKAGVEHVPPSMSDLAADLLPDGIDRAVTQLSAAIHSAAPPQLCNQLAVISSRGVDTDYHPIRKRPQCASCGGSDGPALAPIVLHPRPKGQSGQGGYADEHRPEDAETTLARLAPQISPITGLVGGLKRTTSDTGIYVYRGGRYSTKQPQTYQDLRRSLTFCGAGKGVTKTQAKIGAVAETLEWYTLGAPPVCPIIEASYSDLSRTERVLSPETLSHFSVSQLASAQAAKAAGTEVSARIPESFDPDIAIPWRPVWSLTNSAWAYCPASYCHWSIEARLTPTDSNGMAAGSSLEDAIIHGLNEVIERDAVAIWWYNFIKRPGLDLDGLSPSFLTAVRDYQASLNREFWVIDVTSDLAIPSFAAISVDKDSGDSLGVGFGTHLDATVAASRALAELNQLMPVRDQFVPRTDRPDTGRENKRDISTLRPDPDVPAQRFSEYANHSTHDISRDIETTVARLKSRDLEVFVADVTQPDVDLSVVKVIVPGLRHIYPEFGPGRLFDVPVTMGWRDTPIQEADIADVPSPL